MIRKIYKKKHKINYYYIQKNKNITVLKNMKMQYVYCEYISVYTSGS